MGDLPTIAPGDLSPANNNRVTRAAIAKLMTVEDTANGAQTTANGALQKSNNLSDLANAITALANLGIQTTITEVGDADYTILSSDWIIVTTTNLTAARTWTLPAANAIQPWHPIIMLDRAGAINGANGITIQRAGSDTIDGINSVGITTQFGGSRFYSNHTSKWTFELTIADAGLLLDRIGSTRGSVLYRGSGGWAALTPGTSGYYLGSNGGGADPSYQPLPASGGTTLLSSGAVGTGATYSVTGIGGYKTFMIVLREVSHNSGSNQSFRVAVSGNNGSTYGTAAVVSIVFSGATLVSGFLFGGNMDQVNNQLVYQGAITGGLTIDTSSRGPINALQFSWSGGNFDNGSIDIYGLK